MQLGAIRKTCKDVDFVFLEPPIVVEKADMPWNQNLSNFSSDTTTDEEAQTAETTPRAWWLTAENKMVYTRFEESLKYIHDFLLREERFDVSRYCWGWPNSGLGTDVTLGHHRLLAGRLHVGHPMRSGELGFGFAGGYPDADRNSSLSRGCTPPPGQKAIFHSSNVRLA